MSAFVSQNLSKHADKKSGQQIFDRTRIRQHRLRATRKLSAHDALLRHIADGLCARLDMIARDFSHALIIGAPHDILPPSRLMPKISSILYGDSVGAMLPHHGVRIVFDEEQLPFDRAQFDLIISFWNLHLVNDVPGALQQYRNALRPDGLFLAALAGGHTLTELRESFYHAELSIVDAISPHIHPFAGLRDIGDLLPRAGFALPVADSETLMLNYTTVFDLIADLRGMGASNALLARANKGLRRDVLAHACDFYRANHSTAEGRYAARFDIYYLTAWAPHPSQPQPLAPGSGRVSLTEIFKDKPGR